MRPVHHIGYVVPDLAEAARRFACTLGAGPFLSIGHVPLPDATWRGEPAVYDHSTAFGMWGETLVELSQIHEAAPAELVHTGSAGPVRAHWFDGGALFGHPIEVLRRCPENLSLYAAVREAAADWDGTEPLRPAFASAAAS